MMVYSTSRMHIVPWKCLLGGCWVIYSVLPWRQGGKGLISSLSLSKGLLLLAALLILALFYFAPCLLELFSARVATAEWVVPPGSSKIAALR